MNLNVPLEKKGDVYYLTLLVRNRRNKAFLPREKATKQTRNEIN